MPQRRKLFKDKRTTTTKPPKTKYTSLKLVKKKKKAKHIFVGRHHTERSVKMTVYLEQNCPYSETEEPQTAKCACSVVIGNCSKVFRNSTMTHHC